MKENDSPPTVFLETQDGYWGKSGKDFYILNQKDVIDVSNIDFLECIVIDLYGELLHSPNKYTTVESIIITYLERYIGNKDIDLQNVITDVNELLKLWSEEKSEISYKDGEILVNDIKLNNSLEHRGSGFQAYVYLVFMMYIVINSTKIKHKLIIIEEPERMLHPQAQHDLAKALKYTLEKDTQVQFIITTHSTILISELNGTEEVQTILLKKSEDGSTKVKPLLKTSNYKEIREELGNMLSDTLFFCKVTLIVEGSCEKAFILDLLKKVGRYKVNIEDISVVNAGGADKIKSIIKIYNKEKGLTDTIVVFIDDDREGRRVTQQIKTEVAKIVKVGNGKDEKAFEDLFPEQLRLEATYNIYENEFLEKNINQDKFKESFSSYIEEREIVQNPLNDDEKILVDKINDFLISKLKIEENNLKNEMLEHLCKKKVRIKELCWAKQMESYLKCIGVIEERNEIDKFKICRYMTEKIKTNEIPEKICELAKIIGQIQEL